MSANEEKGFQTLATQEEGVEAETDGGRSGEADQEDPADREEVHRG
jgi:hypothetical protein